MTSSLRTALITLGAGQFADALALAADRYGIDTPLRQAHWLAQVAHESGGFTRTRESLNYSVSALLTLFGRHRISEEDAERYGRTAERPANQPAIANCLYGGEWGRRNLGNTQPGDGARFIGRGLKQTTGRANTARTSDALYGDTRLLDTPELLEEPEAAAFSAGFFWDDKNINPLADADDLAAVTRRINGGIIGLEERGRWLLKAKAVLR